MTKIREATLSDEEAIRAIYAYYTENTAISWEIETPSAGEFLGRMERIMSRYPYLVIEEDGVIRGYAYAGPFVGRAAYDWSCELSIYLDPKARKHGMGRQLYTAMEEKLCAMGIRNLYACIGVPESKDDPYLTNNSAQFHAHLGFTEVGRFRRCGNKFGRWYTMIWMEKIVGDHPDEPTPVKWYDEEEKKV